MTPARVRCAPRARRGLLMPQTEVGGHLWEWGDGAGRDLKWGQAEFNVSRDSGFNVAAWGLMKGSHSSGG